MGLKFSEIVSLDRESLTDVEGNQEFIVTVNTKTGSGKVVVRNNFNTTDIQAYALELINNCILDTGVISFPLFRLSELLSFLDAFTDVDLSEITDDEVNNIPFIDWIEDIYTAATQCCVTGRYAMLKKTIATEYKRAEARETMYTPVDYLAIKLVGIIDKLDEYATTISKIADIDPEDMKEMINGIQNIPEDQLANIASDPAVKEYVMKKYAKGKKTSATNIKAKASADGEQK